MSGRGSGSMARACPERRPLFKECDIGHPATADAIDGPVFIDRSAIGRIFAQNGTDTATPALAATSRIVAFFREELRALALIAVVMEEAGVFAALG